MAAITATTAAQMIPVGNYKFVLYIIPSGSAADTLTCSEFISIKGFYACLATGIPVLLWTAATNVITCTTTAPTAGSSVLVWGV